MTITTIFFDLDDTLYPAKSALWRDIRERISLYMRERLGISAEETPILRQKYLEQYGTTLRGLYHHYEINVEEFLDFVHDLPLSQYIQPDSQQRAIIQAIPAKKFIFSNADIKHIHRALHVLALEDCFDGVLDILEMWPLCKPMTEAFGMAFQLAGNPNPKQCVMIDDLPRNTSAARQQGIFSILYGPHALTHPNEADAILTDWAALPGLLNSL